MERITTNSHVEMLRELVPAHSSEPFEEEEDAEERLARSRDRNREHARRTRGELRIAIMNLVAIFVSSSLLECPIMNEKEGTHGH